MSGRARQAGATEAGLLGENFQQACPIDNRFRGRQPPRLPGGGAFPWQHIHTLGVYIEEISSRQHNIATSIAAFIG